LSSTNGATPTSRLFGLDIETAQPADLLRRIIGFADRAEHRRVSYVNAHVLNQSFGDDALRAAGVPEEQSRLLCCDYRDIPFQRFNKISSLEMVEHVGVKNLVSFYEQVRDLLADEEKWPKELLFIGRNMRIVQGNNQYLGSPVNRVKIMGTWASASQYADPHRPLRERAAAAWRHVLLRAVLAASDLVFYWYALKQLFGFSKGMEDEVEERMKAVAKDMGVELNHDVFDG